MKISEVISFLEEHAPLSLQESYDNAGLLVGDQYRECSGVLVSLDATEAVVDEAVALGVNMIVSHHPIIFSGLKQITGETYIQRAILKAIKNDIALYAIHTNLDNVSYRGVNSKICEKIGINESRILLPKFQSDDSKQIIGAGMIGQLTSKMDELTFMSHLKDVMELKVLRHTKLLNNSVSKIAVCGGSGRFLLQEAIDQNADVFISSDFKYHEFFDANDKILLIDIGHYESEKYTIDLLVELINEKFTNFAARFSKTNTNPVSYF